MSYSHVATLSRVLKYSWQGIGRNIWLSIITVSTITLTLLSISLLVALQVGITQIVRAAERRIDLSIYFFPEVTPAQSESVAVALRALDGVTEITVVSKEEAFRRYADTASATPELVKPLEAIGENPFGPSLTIKANTPADYERVIEELRKEQYAGLIEDEQRDYESSRNFISNFQGFTDKVRLSAIAISGLFALIASLLLFNTMRVAIYTHREEIAVMKLVGASNRFVRAPFLLDAFIYCLLATGITAGLTFLGLSYGQPYLNSYFGSNEVDLYGYFFQGGLIIFGAEFLFILFLSSISTTLAIRKYLRV